MPKPCRNAHGMKRGIRPADRLWGLIGKLCRYEITENSSTYPGIAILDCANLGDRKGCADLQAFRSSKIAFQISRSIRIQPDPSDQT